jgi:hypothetical protein
MGDSRNVDKKSSGVADRKGFIPLTRVRMNTVWDFINSCSR